MENINTEAKTQETEVKEKKTIGQKIDGFNKKVCDGAKAFIQHPVTKKVAKGAAIAGGLAVAAVVGLKVKEKHDAQNDGLEEIEIVPAEMLTEPAEVTYVEPIEMAPVETTEVTE